MNINDLLNKIERYGFECEAGKLENCIDWQALRAAVEEREALKAGLSPVNHPNREQD